MSGQKVIVLGAGHNGLVAAALLAKAGAQVTLYERANRFGGLAGVTQSQGERGEQHQLAATDFGLFRRDLAERLDLAAHGWHAEQRHAQAGELIGWRAPGAGEARGAKAKVAELRLFCDRERLVDAVAQHSRRDASQMAGFLEHVASLAEPFEDLLRSTPTFEQTAAVARQPELIRFLSASLNDSLGWWFESDAVKVALAGLALQNTGLAPRHEGTGWLLLYQLAGTKAQRLRPAVEESAEERGRFVEALVAAARAAGVTMHDRLGASRIEARGGKQQAVVLDDGTQAEADVVISTLDAPATLLGLVGAQHLPVRAVRMLRRLRIEGSTVRRLGDDQDPGSSGRTVVAESLDAMQRAQDCAKRGLASTQPWLLCGQGWANGHYLPFSVCEDEAQVADFQRAMDRSLRDCWGAGTDRNETRWLSALDWQRMTGATQGCETGSWMSMDQNLVLRPIPGWSGVKTPIEGLLLGGAAAHPGGGVTGLCGLAAAEAALRLL